MRPTATWRLFLGAFMIGRAGLAEEALWLVYDGFDGPGKGKHIVLVSGDEEYRSEEALPQLGKILAKRHGFKCTALFPIDPERGDIVNPECLTNIPGLEALDDADLMIIATRFRALPDEQMEHIDAYLKSGRPVLGMRTANHGFRFPKDSEWAHYSFRYDGPKEEWKGGFGIQVLGDHFRAHHGWHGRESTRGLIAPGAKDHPIVRGIKDGDIWGPTDVYTVKMPFPKDQEPIVLGQVLEGMNPDDKPVGPGPYERGPKGVTNKNDPMMPVTWTRPYRVPGGKQGRALATTMGAASDLTSEGTRRMLVNGVYWLLDMADEIPAGGTDVDLVGEFEPTMYGTRKNEYWIEKGLKVSDFALEK